MGILSSEGVTPSNPIVGFSSRFQQGLSSLIRRRGFGGWLVVGLWLGWVGLGMKRPPNLTTVDTFGATSKGDGGNDHDEAGEGGRGGGREEAKDGIGGDRQIHVRRGSFHEDRQRELLEHPGIHSVNFPSKSGDRVPSPVLGGHGDFMSARGGERLASVLHRTGPEAAHETVEMVRSGSGASTEKSKPMAKIDLMHWTPDGDGASSTGTAASVRKAHFRPRSAKKPMLKHTWRHHKGEQFLSFKGGNVANFIRGGDTRDKDEASLSRWSMLGTERDVVDDDERKAEDNHIAAFPFLVLNPRSVHRIRWNIWMMFLLYVTTFFVLFRMSFEYTQLGRRNLNGDEPGWGIYNSNLIYIEYSMDAFFFLDFIVQFRTAYFARHGKHNNWVLVADPTSIVIRYITTWFIIDALSGIPFEFANDMLAYTTNGKNPMRNDLQPHESLAWTRLIRICKVFQYSDRFRLTRLGRMDRHIQAWREWTVLHSGIVRIIKLFAVFVLLLQALGCLVFFLGTLSAFQVGDEPFYPVNKDGVPGRSWIQIVTIVARACYVNQETGETRCASGNVSVSKAPVVSQLIVSIYFITSTMTQVGYGDIFPVTEIETGILMMAMLLGASIFSYTVSNATSFITELEGRGGHNQKYMDHVSTFLVDCGLSKPLRVQIMNFFEKRLSRSHIALPKISEGMPLELAAELKLRICHTALFITDGQGSSNEKKKKPGKEENVASGGSWRAYISLTPLLRGLDDHVMCRIVNEMQFHELISGEICIQGGKEQAKVVFLLSGRLEAVDADGASLGSFAPGSYLGENAILGSTPNVCTVRAKTWCEILQLDFKKCRHILLECEEENAHWMHTVAEVRWSRFAAAVELSKWLRREVKRATREGREDDADAFTAAELVKRLANEEETYFDPTLFQSINPTLNSISSSPDPSTPQSAIRSIGLASDPTKNNRGKGGHLSPDSPARLERRRPTGGGLMGKLASMAQTGSMTRLWTQSDPASLEGVQEGESAVVAFNLEGDDEEQGGGGGATQDDVVGRIQVYKKEDLGGGEGTYAPFTTRPSVVTWSGCLKTMSHSSVPRTVGDVSSPATGGGLIADDEDGGQDNSQVEGASRDLACVAGEDVNDLTRSTPPPPYQSEARPSQSDAATSSNRAWRPNTAPESPPRSPEQPLASVAFSSSARRPSLRMPDAPRGGSSRGQRPRSRGGAGVVWADLREEVEARQAGGSERGQGWQGAGNSPGASGRDMLILDGMDEEGASVPVLDVGAGGVGRGDDQEGPSTPVGSPTGPGYEGWGGAVHGAAFGTDFGVEDLAVNDAGWAQAAETTPKKTTKPEGSEPLQVQRQSSKALWGGVIKQAAVNTPSDSSKRASSIFSGFRSSSLEPSESGGLGQDSSSRGGSSAKGQDKPQSSLSFFSRLTMFSKKGNEEDKGDLKRAAVLTEIESPDSRYSKLFDADFMKGETGARLRKLARDHMRPELASSDPSATATYSHGEINQLVQNHVNEGESIDWGRDWLDSPEVVRIATKRQKIAFPKTVVKITIVEAEELSNLQLLDLLDPFVRLEHARGEYQTQVCSDTKHPVWNESYVLESRGKAILQTPVIVSVYDYDSTLDNIIGQVSISLKSLPPNERVDSWYDITNEEGERAGRVRIKLKLTPPETRELDGSDTIFSKMRAGQGRAVHNLLNTLAHTLTRLERLEGTIHLYHRRVIVDIKSQVQHILRDLRHVREKGGESGEEMVQAKRLLEAVGKLSVRAATIQREKAHNFHQLFATNRAKRNNSKSNYSNRQDSKSPDRQDVPRNIDDEGLANQLAYSVVAGLAHWTHMSYLHSQQAKSGDGAGVIEDEAEDDDGARGGGGGRRRGGGDEWQMCVSRSRGKPFWYNKYTGESRWQHPPPSRSSTPPPPSTPPPLEAQEAPGGPPGGYEPHPPPKARDRPPPPKGRNARLEARMDMALSSAHVVPPRRPKVAQRKGSESGGVAQVGGSEKGLGSSGDKGAGRVHRVGGGGAIFGLEDMPEGWVMRVSRVTGQPYYQDVVGTGDTSWKPPPSAASSGAAYPMAFAPSEEDDEDEDEEEVRLAVERGIRDAASLPVSVSIIPSRVPSIMAGDSTGESTVAQRFFAVNGERAGLVVYGETDSRDFFCGGLHSVDGMGVRIGLGELVYRDGVRYLGNWEKNVANGKGVEDFPGVGEYAGCFQGDLRHGVGVIECGPLKYYGPWKEGRRHGKGVERIMIGTDPVECITVVHRGTLIRRTAVTAQLRAMCKAIKANAEAAAAEAEEAASKAQGLAEGVQDKEKARADAEQKHMSDLLKPKPVLTNLRMW